MANTRLAQLTRTWGQRFLAASLAVAVFLGYLSQVNAAENCEAIACSRDAMSDSDYLDCNHRKQACWEKNIQDAKSSAVTLQSTISVLNGQISLQQLQIDQTLAEISKLETEIESLTNAISNLSLSLDNLTKLLMARAREQYRQSRSSVGPLQVMLTSNFGQALSQLQYLAITQQQTVKAMQLTESQRLVFDEQKQLKEKKQNELAVKKAQLSKQQDQLKKQKADQQFLLKQTQNDEARYQSELAKTLSELQAIQSILAGQGNETKVRTVQEGDMIASIISGASACSTGTHLHFEVSRGGAMANPAEFLRSADITWNNQPDGSFGFNGSWRWPLSDPARITQGYGMTYYAAVKRSYGGAPHTGIDMLSKNGDLGVKAVKPGTLYRGSIKCGGGLLRYVRVEHSGENISTYYLHVNY